MENGKYILPQELPREMVRLRDQGEWYDSMLGGFFVGLDEEEPSLQRVLDVGCGPATTILMDAERYPAKHFTGLEISERMIHYARSQATLNKLENVHLEVGDAAQPFPYAPASFDLVFARFVFAFISLEAWPAFIQRCATVTASGGWLKIIEGTGEVTSSSEINNLVWSACMEGFYRAKRAYSPHSIGLVERFPQYLAEAGYSHVQQNRIILHIQHGTPGWKAMTDDYRAMYNMLLPALKHVGVITDTPARPGEMTEKEYRRAVRDAAQAMQQKNFVCSFPVVITVAQKGGK